MYSSQELVHTNGPDGWTTSRHKKNAWESTRKWHGFLGISESIFKLKEKRNRKEKIWMSSEYSMTTENISLKKII